MSAALRGGVVALLALLGATRGIADCTSDAETLCLQQNRFRVRADWRNPFGPGSGAGKAVELTSDTGFFWFFTPENLEVTVKVLDGRTFNERFWVFYGALSNLEFELFVTDLATGWERSYLNPPFEQTTGASITAFAEDPLPGDLLFVGAHPDDEALVAPILGRQCRELGRSCSFLLLTRGENGACRLPQGCLPDLGSVRAQEMASVAAYYQASLDLRTLPDRSGPTPTAVRAAWAQASGGDAALVAAVRAAIVGSGAETVITLDSRHGSTCHPAHRAVGGIVRDAVADLAAAPELYEVETWFSTPPAFAWRAAVRGDAETLAFDGDRPAAAIASTAWDYLLANAAIHASQVPPELLAVLAAQPANERRVFLRRADAPADPRYAALCGGD